MRALSILRRSTRRMEHWIRDRLHIAGFPIEKQPADLTVLLDEILDAHEPLAVERGIALVRDLRVEGVNANVDRDRIAQVLATLIGNSIQACRTGNSITVRAEYDEWCVRCTVEDTGPGEQDIGLSVCKSIVEAHGGTIEVRSKPGVATAFTITLPLDYGLAGA